MCSVEIISLTQRFNAVNTNEQTKNRLNGFRCAHRSRTRLKPGVNEKLPKASRILSRHVCLKAVQSLRAADKFI
jgi:hypothetical protein